MIYNQIILENSGLASKINIGGGVNRTAHGNVRKTDKARSMFGQGVVRQAWGLGSKVPRSEERNIASYPLFTVEPAQCTTKTGIAAISGNIYKSYGSSDDKFSNLLGWLMKNWGKTDEVDPGETINFNLKGGLILPRDEDDPSDGRRYNTQRRNSIQLKIWQIVWLLKNNACTIAVKRGISYGNQVKNIANTPFIKGLLDKLYNFVNSDSDIVNTVYADYGEKRAAVAQADNLVNGLRTIQEDLTRIFFTVFAWDKRPNSDSEISAWLNRIMVNPRVYIKAPRSTIIRKSERLANQKTEQNKGLVMNIPGDLFVKLSDAYNALAKTNSNDDRFDINSIKNIVEGLEKEEAEKEWAFQAPIATFLRPMADLYREISAFLAQDWQTASTIHATTDFIESIINVTTDPRGLLAGLKMLNDPDYIKQYLNKIFPNYNEDTIDSMAELSPEQLAVTIASTLLIDKGYVNEHYDASKPFNEDMFGNNGDFKAHWDKLQRSYYSLSGEKRDKKINEEMAKYVKMTTDNLINQLPPPASIFKDDSKGNVPKNLAEIKVSQPQLDNYLPTALNPDELAELIKPFDYFIVHKNAGSSTFTAVQGSSALDTKYKTVYEYVISNEVDTVASTNKPINLVKETSLRDYTIKEIENNPDKYGLLDNSKLIELLDTIEWVKQNKDIRPDAKVKRIAKINRDIDVIYGLFMSKIIFGLWFNYVNAYAGQGNTPEFDASNIKLLSPDYHAKDSILDADIEKRYKTKIISASTGTNTASARIAPYIEAFKRKNPDEMANADKYTGFISVDQYVDAILNKRDEYFLTDEYFKSYISNLRKQSNNTLNTKRIGKVLHNCRTAFKNLVDFVLKSIKKESDAHSNVYNLEDTIGQFKKKNQEPYKFALKYVNMGSVEELASMFRRNEEGTYLDDQYYYNGGNKSDIGRNSFKELVKYVRGKSHGFAITRDNNIVRDVADVIEKKACGANSLDRPKVVAFFGAIGECLRRGQEEYGRFAELSDARRYKAKKKNNEVTKGALREYDPTNIALRIIKVLLKGSSAQKEFIKTKFELGQKTFKDKDCEAFDAIILALRSAMNVLKPKNSLENVRAENVKNETERKAAQTEADRNAAEAKEAPVRAFVSALVGGREMKELTPLLYKAYRENVTNPIGQKTAISVQHGMSLEDALYAIVLTVGVAGKEEDGSEICGIGDEEMEKESIRFFNKTLKQYIKTIKERGQEPDFNELHKLIIKRRQNIGKRLANLVRDKLIDVEGTFIGSDGFKTTTNNSPLFSEGASIEEMFDAFVNELDRIKDTVTNEANLKDTIMDLRYDITSIKKYVECLPTLDKLRDEMKPGK